jgi:hypothetical protein
VIPFRSAATPLATASHGSNFHGASRSAIVSADTPGREGRSVIGALLCPFRSVVSKGSDPLIGDRL